MRWTVHGERDIYASEWVTVALADVEIPDGPRFEHHVVHVGRPASGVIVLNDADEMLLLWRHRFITDTWGYEIPAGGIDPGESAIDAGRREVLEETGWSVTGALAEVVTFFPMNGLSDQTFTIFLARGATHVGEPVDASESERIEWVPLAKVRAAIRNGEMGDGLSLTGITYALATGLL
jgi:8-oxo-dGTP pyrophosphatase MutT (NUDIX family)